MRPFGVCFVLAVAALQSVCCARVIVGGGGGGGTGQFDVDGDGRPDISTASGGLPGITTIQNSANVSAEGASNLEFTPTALRPGSVIGPSSTFGLSSISESYLATRDPAGDWQVWSAGGAVDGEYGYRITSQGATHYGWAQVHVQADRNFAIALVFQWAYESDPNTPIAVGAVPEPATAALLLVGAPILLRRKLVNR